MAHSGYALLPSLLFMAGCPSGKPNAEIVGRIEARLQADPCLTRIYQMRRTYSYARRGWKIDPNRIVVWIELAGYDGLPAGRIIALPSKDIGIDDRERFSAAATYVVSSDKIDIWACGGTFTGVRHNPLY